MKNKQRKTWWIDVILFAGFLLAFFLSFTGVALHQWIGVIGGGLAMVHLIMHWDWFEAVGQRFLLNASHKVRLKFLVDSSLLMGFVGIIGTGLVISSWLNLPLTNYQEWLSTHILVSIITVLVLIVKLILHWKWISRTTRSTFLRGVAIPVIPVRQQTSPLSTQGIERREFLKVMGVAGGASLLALISGTQSLAALQSETSTMAGQNTSSNSTTVSDSSTLSQFGLNNNSGNTTCAVRCGKRCSYPGGCHRYSDTDQDGNCDFGECA